MKSVEIECCSQCRYISYCANLKHCYHPSFEGMGQEIKLVGILPPWCPLPNSPGERADSAALRDWLFQRLRGHVEDITACKIAMEFEQQYSALPSGTQPAICPHCTGSGGHGDFPCPYCHGTGEGKQAGGA